MNSKKHHHQVGLADNQMFLYKSLIQVPDSTVSPGTEAAVFYGPLSVSGGGPIVVLYERVVRSIQLSHGINLWQVCEDAQGQCYSGTVIELWVECTRGFGSRMRDF